MGLFELSTDRYVHFYNKEKCVIIYNFTTKRIQLYNFKNTDWAKLIDKHHEYGIIIRSNTYDLTIINDLKIRYLRYHSKNLNNFNPKYPELVKTISIQGEHRNCIEYVDLKQFRAIEYVNLLDVKNVIVSDFGHLSLLRQLQLWYLEKLDNPIPHLRNCT